MLFFYPEITQDILVALSPREQEVLKRRFGLEKERKESLQEIGNDMGITRERVRQVQNRALQRAQERTGRHPRVFSFFDNQLEVSGGLRQREKYVQILSPRPRVDQNHVEFLLTLKHDLVLQVKSTYFVEVWARVGIEKRALKVLSRALSVLREIGEPVSFQDLSERVRVDPRLLLSVIEASKDIQQGPDGLWGLTIWPEIKPKSVGDRAYFILKKEGKPLHFFEIAQRINESLLLNRSKPYHPQTVHNDLIKDPRFVLIGRGIYALSEWGYKPGTVKDVILNILQKAGRPLDKEEIVKEVLRQRQVKRSTISVVLKDKNTFQKLKDGRYTLAD